jgi:chemotaxis protein methyltransferase CheR
MTALQPRGIDRFCELLERLCGLSYSADKAYLFESRLRTVLATHRCRDYEGLSFLLQHDPQARQAIIEALVTSETFFFRDEETFRQLPGVAARFAATPASPLVIWSLGCATGQEVYSILFALDEASGFPLSRLTVLGADISAPVLDRARAAVYSPFEVQRGLTEARRDRYMRPVPGGWGVASPWKEAPTWRTLNLLDGLADLPRPHIVFCRNLLIYFSDANKARVMKELTSRLADDGCIVLGSTESPRPYAGLIRPWADGVPSFYRRA